MVGALEGVTLSARSPSGTNRMTLWGLASCAAAPAQGQGQSRSRVRYFRAGATSILPHRARIKLAIPLPGSQYPAVTTEL